MEYRHLVSLFSRSKTPIALNQQPDFFKVHYRTDNDYVEPTIGKIEFRDRPAPSIILISAVGATGKTRLARELSSSTSLPVLDLSLCRTVGDRTLTGVVNDFFARHDVSRVLEGLANGSYGIIVDAVDEGRSKTSPDGFNAFLDDLVNRCRGSSSPTFVMLGRTVILEECWYYLDNNGIETALATIEPFSVESAKQYINTFSGGLNTQYPTQYESARDKLVDLLKGSFSDQLDSNRPEAEFLRFLGYPPVLDSIVTLLKKSTNYHATIQDIEQTGDSIEASLIYRISTYILRREKDDKILPNVIRDRRLLKGIPETEASKIEKAIFDVEEQCARLVAFCLGATITVDVIADPKLNRQYEDALTESGLLPEHPFLEEGKNNFRNAVFESLALATLFFSTKSDHRQLAYKYASRQKSSYHLIYMLDARKQQTADTLLDANCLKFIVDAALEFRSVSSGTGVGHDPTTHGAFCRGY